MKQDNLAEDVLRALDIAVLRRIGPDRYEPLGEPPSFYSAFFPSTEAGPCAAPWEHSYMLEFFHESAETFFASGQPGVVSSGLWQEEDLCDQDQAMEAEARTLGQTQIVIIRLLKESYGKQAAILCKARKELLGRRALKNDLETYRQRSRTDGLTKLLNKTSLLELLNLHVERAIAQNLPLALIMLDIDDFKGINDRYGHQAGDLALAELSRILLRSLRHDDLVGRYGGDEFMVIVPAASMEHAARLAEKLRQAMETHESPGLPRLSLSLGCATLRSEEIVDAFIERADQALYDAKHAGKNRVSCR